MRIKGTLKIDPSKKPKTIDMTITEGRRDEDKGKELHGIYELEKDALKWSTSEPGARTGPRSSAPRRAARICSSRSRRKRSSPGEEGREEEGPRAPGALPVERRPRPPVVRGLDPTRFAERPGPPNQERTFDATSEA